MVVVVEEEADDNEKYKHGFHHLGRLVFQATRTESALSIELWLVIITMCINVIISTKM